MSQNNEEKQPERLELDIDGIEVSIEPEKPTKFVIRGRDKKIEYEERRDGTKILRVLRPDYQPEPLKPPRAPLQWWLKLPREVRIFLYILMALIILGLLTGKLDEAFEAVEDLFTQRFLR